MAPSLNRCLVSKLALQSDQQKSIAHIKLNLPTHYVQLLHQRSDSSCSACSPDSRLIARGESSNDMPLSRSSPQLPDPRSICGGQEGKRSKPTIDKDVERRSVAEGRCSRRIGRIARVPHTRWRSNICRSALGAANG